MIKFFKNKIKNFKRKVAEKLAKDALEDEVMKRHVIEYNLIQEKKSLLSKKERDIVESNVAVLIASGKLKITMLK